MSVNTIIHELNIESMLGAVNGRENLAYAIFVISLRTVFDINVNELRLLSFEGYVI